MHVIIKQNKYYKTVLFIVALICIFNKQKAHAADVYVYCATEKGHWHWLDHKKVKVRGQWKKKYISYLAYQRYFRIDGGINAVIDLQKQCIREFGQDYKYAQPADKKYTGWFLFGDENGFIVDGISDVYKLFIRI